MTRLRHGLLLTLMWLHPAMAAGVMGDPTEPASSHAYQKQGDFVDGWALSYTLVGPERRIAIINGKAVREGDRIGNFRVSTISASEVRLQGSQRHITLRLLSGSLPKRNAAEAAP